MNKRMMLLLAYVTVLQAQEIKTSQQLCADGQSRPYAVYTPTKPSPETRPLLVFLHGAAASPQISTNPEGYVRKSPLVALAEAAGCYLLFYFGRKGTTWFGAVGQQMVMDEITAVKQQYPIDPDKIFLSGFSDSGSGVYYFAIIQPDPFTGFIATNGNLRVVSILGGEEIFPCNINQKPLYILNTNGDSLYPLEQITPPINFLREENPNITFKTPTGDHFLDYLPKGQSALVSFIKNHTHQPFAHIAWETSSINKINRIGWLGLRSLALEQERVPRHTLHPKVTIQNNRADLGIEYDYAYKGKGLRIAGFRSDTVTTKHLGTKEDDIPLASERDNINSPVAPILYTVQKKAGDPAKLTVLREGATPVLKGNFNQGYPYALLKHQHGTAKIKAETRGNELYVRTSRIAAYRIDGKQTPVKIKGKVKDFINEP